MTKPPLLIVGYGRFGAFAAGFLKRRFDVHVLDRRRSITLPPGIKKTEAADLGRFDIVLLAIPAGRVERFLARYGPSFKPGSFVADLCAVKSAPAAWMRKYLPGAVSFAGLHPLFGPSSAAGGPGGHSIAVCHGRSTAACRRKLLSTIRWYDMKPVETTPAIHDRTMASTLFLTQAIGNALPAPTSRVPFETPSYGLLRRIGLTAKGNSPELIRELLAFNPYCRRMLRRTRGRFSAEFTRLAKISENH